MGTRKLENILFWVFEIVIIVSCLYFLYFITITLFPKIHTPEIISLTQEKSVDYLKKEVMKKDFAMSFVIYAKNQGIHLSQLKAEYYAAIVIDRAETYSLQPALVKALLVVESGANVNALSTKGAKGLMQIMPNTAKDYHCKNLFEPEDNIDCGTRILKDLISKYGEYAGIRHYLCGDGAAKYGCLWGVKTDAYLAAIKAAIKREAI